MRTLNKMTLYVEVPFGQVWGLSGGRDFKSFVSEQLQEEHISSRLLLFL